MGCRSLAGGKRGPASRLERNVLGLREPSRAALCGTRIAEAPALSQALARQNWLLRLRQSPHFPHAGGGSRIRYCHVPWTTGHCKEGRVVALTPVDRDLLRRCLDHQPGAWNDFVDRYLGLIYHVIHHTAHSRSTPLQPE